MPPTLSVQTLEMNLQTSRDAPVSVHHKSCRFKNRWRELVACFCVTFIVPAVTGE